MSIFLHPTTISPAHPGSAKTDPSPVGRAETETFSNRPVALCSRKVSAERRSDRRVLFPV